jgi:hypothetical protein
MKRVKRERGDDDEEEGSSEEEMKTKRKLKNLNRLAELMERGPSRTPDRQPARNDWLA